MQFYLQRLGGLLLICLLLLLLRFARFSELVEHAREVAIGDGRVVLFRDEVLQPPVLHFELGNPGFESGILGSHFLDGTFEVLLALLFLNPESGASCCVAASLVFLLSQASSIIKRGRILLPLGPRCGWSRRCWRMRLGLWLGSSNRRGRLMMR